MASLGLRVGTGRHPVGARRRPGSARADFTCHRQPHRLAPVRLLDGRTLAPLQPGAAASVVVFFSTTCPYCARHNVHVQKLLAATRGLPLRVLGVAHDKQPELVTRYLARRGLSFDVTLDQGPLHAALSRKPGIPLTCVVDRQQRLREVSRGEMFEDDVLGLARWASA